jgi:hypothetical protein
MEHVSIARDGGLSSLDHRVEWPIAIELRYDADTEPGPR